MSEIVNKEDNRLPGKKGRHAEKSVVARLLTLGLVVLSGLVFLLQVGAASGSPLSGQEIRELYSQGTEFFHQAAETGESDPAAARDLYTKAALRFERIVEEGAIRNGKLYYNIGNIYFLLDDVGRAIVNYRRAEHYIPNDPNLAKNLAYARTIRKDRLETTEQEKIFQTLFFFHYDLGPHTRLILFAVFYLLFWLIAGTRIFSRRPYTAWSLGISFVFFLIFGISLYVEGRQAGSVREGVILDSEVIARQGDAESYQPSFKDPLHAGTEFKLQEERSGWWLVELPDGRSTWIQSKSGELVR